METKQRHTLGRCRIHNPVDNLHRCGLTASVGAGAPVPLALPGQSARRAPDLQDRGGPRRSMICLESSGVSREAYLSTQQPSPSPQARVPCAHEHPRWSGSVEVSPGQGPGSSLGLIDRVRERDAFVRLRRDGVRVRTDPLWCSLVLDPDLVPPQVAFAIGRAVGSAVSRNRLRRRLRAVLAGCDVPPGLYLIGARAPACEQTFAEVERTVESLLTKIHRHQMSLR